MLFIIDQKEVILKNPIPIKIKKAIATRNLKEANQNLTHTENMDMGKNLMPSRADMESPTVIKNPKAANQSLTHTGNMGMGKNLMPSRADMESPMVTTKVHTGVMARVLLNT